MNSLSWPHMKAGANSNSSGQWWSSLFDPWLDKWADCLSEFYDWTSLIWESKNRTSPWICLEDFCFERFTQILQLWCSTSNVVNPESPACLQILTWFVRSSQILDLGKYMWCKNDSNQTRVATKKVHLPKCMGEGNRSRSKVRVFGNAWDGLTHSSCFV